MPDVKTDEMPEIEVTPEMVEAGTDIVWKSPIDCPTEDEMREMVRKVFAAMTRARRQSHA